MLYNFDALGGATGMSGTAPSNFVPWLPSTWPNLESNSNDLVPTIRDIWQETILTEISNVISDAQKNGNAGLERRGHVIALAILCAIDAVASYAFPPTRSVPCASCGRSDGIGPNYQKFIKEFFPEKYKMVAADLYKLYRNNLVHSWNLFEATMTPGDEEPTKAGGVLTLGLNNFFGALQESVENFLTMLETDNELRMRVIDRYNQLRKAVRQ